ncbi:MAG: hypothetical protein L0322_18490, partial [Chloroflexi bacterium]|nr:hypothetical protein [Chloroflexota bacterium]
QRAGLDFGSALPVEPGPKSADLVRRGILSYLDLFSSRQLLYLRQALAHLPGDDEAVRLYLALLVSTSLEFNSMLCGYKGGSQHRPGAIRHTFSLHAYSFPYTALENNPLYPRPASGTLLKLFHDRVARARRWAASPHERALTPAGPRQVAIAGEQDLGVEVSRPAGLQFGTRRFLLRQGSAAALDLPDGSVDYVVTDPPYFDSVQYSDLAAFFRVWLRLLLPAGGQAGICWEYDTAGSAVDPQANGRGPLVNGQYVQVISAIFAECHRVLRQAGGRLIFTFHHWNPRGWAAVTLALQRAGFLLVNYYVVHSENPISVHIANFKALTHDAILVLAPTEADIRRSWDRPAAVDTADSHRFCQGCAQLLGWMLATGLADEEVERLWVGVIG